MFLDKDDQYNRIDGNVGGLYQLFDSNTRAVTGASSMPTVLLYGDQTSGLSGSSNDDLRLWDDHLESERNFKLRKPIEKISRWLMMSEDIPGDVDFGIKFNSSLPKTMNEKIDETRAVLDMYSQLKEMGLYTDVMILAELKERDDLLIGNQIQQRTEEDMLEVMENVADENGMPGGMPGGGEFEGGPGGGAMPGDENFDDDFAAGFEEGGFGEEGGGGDISEEPASLAPEGGGDMEPAE